MIKRYVTSEDAIVSEFVCFWSLPVCVDDVVDVDHTASGDVTFQMTLQCKSQICIHD